jgi:cytochrome d ubiquinol oxidase subunit II
MSAAADYIPLLWSGVAVAAILAYVLMDGWVLGIGILYPLVARQADRDRVIQSIAPFWKANETRFVLGAILLLLGFPIAYSLSLAQLYLPIFAMLFALVVRGASYAFRHRGGSLRRIWDLAFAGGSILATLAQGYLVGRVIEGLGGNVDTSGLIGWLRALFPILCSLGLLGGYGLLGACWLIFKADGALQVMGREVSHSTLILAATLMVVVCLLIPIVGPHVAHRWLDPSMRIGLALFAAAALVVIWQLWRSLWQIKDYRPLQWAVALFMLAFTGVAISLYPYIVPYRFTYYELANDPSFLKFASVGLCVVLTVIILCLLLGYRRLRGKIPRADAPVGAPPVIASRKTCGNNVDLHLS